MAPKLNGVANAVQRAMEKSVTEFGLVVPRCILLKPTPLMTLVLSRIPQVPVPALLKLQAMVVLQVVLTRRKIPSLLCVHQVLLQVVGN